MIPRSTSTGATATSLFTIDSILAPKDKGSESPVSPSSNSSATTSPVRPQHVPAMLQHPGLHLGHLAAAAGFGTSPSDFLGESSCQNKFVLRGNSTAKEGWFGIMH